MKNKVILEIKDASFSVPRIETPILNKINYEVYEGDFIIVLGSNGSGKSTLLKLIDKRLGLNKNTIFLEGHDINSYSQKNYYEKVKTLTQNCNDSLFPSLTIFENYILARKKKFFNKKKESEFLKEYLYPFNPKLSTKLHQIVEELSGGEKQTLALALTILHPPLLLLLDEHTSALDPRTAELNMQLTRDMVEKNKITCLLTTHNLNIAEQYGNRILAIRHGNILACVESEQKKTLHNKLMYEMFY